MRSFFSSDRFLISIVILLQIILLPPAQADQDFDFDINIIYARHDGGWNKIAEAYSSNEDRDALSKRLDSMSPCVRNTINLGQIFLAENRDQLNAWSKDFEKVGERMQINVIYESRRRSSRGDPSKYYEKFYIVLGHVNPPVVVPDHMYSPEWDVNATQDALPPFVLLSTAVNRPWRFGENGNTKGDEPQFVGPYQCALLSNFSALKASSSNLLEARKKEVYDHFINPYEGSAAFEKIDPIKYTSPSTRESQKGVDL